MAMDIPEMPMDLQLAAVIHLLSSSALRGATPAKTDALRSHLRGIAAANGLNPHLREVLLEALDSWEAVDCHPASVAVTHPPLAPAGLALH